MHSGYSVIAPDSVHSLFANATRAGALDYTVLQELSLREKEVFMLAAKGLSNQQIALALFIAEATVKTHLRSVRSKVGLETRISLVAFAYEHHLMG